MDEKKEEKIVIESQKEEIKTDTEKTERSRNRITKIPHLVSPSQFNIITCSFHIPSIHKRIIISYKFRNFQSQQNVFRFLFIEIEIKMQTAIQEICIQTNVPSLCCFPRNITNCIILLSSSQ